MGSVLIILLSWFILSPTNGQWIKNVIDNNLNQPTSFCTDDIDGDGDEDIVAAIYGQKDIILYENKGGDPVSWTKHIIDNNLGGVGVYLTDLDGDEKMDVVVAGHASDQVKWYRNMRGYPISWTPNVIDYSLGGAEFVYVADIDKDDDLDVIATGALADHVVWYENDGTSTSWTKHIIDNNLDGAGVCIVKDIDGDDTLDVAVNAIFAGDVVWYKNTNKGQKWTKYTIDDNLPGTSEIDIADIDNDNDPDLVASGTDDNDVVLYENKGGDPVSWTKHIIDGNLYGAFAVKFADMDKDNDLDVVATGRYAQEVAWYENNGGSPDSWSKSTIGTGLSTAWEVTVSDVDGDDTLDVIVNQFIANGSIVWYNKVLTPPNDIKAAEDRGKYLKLYPNPSDGLITIELNNPRDAELEIYDLLGKMVLRKNMQSNLETIDISMYPKGVYLVKINQKETLKVQKIMLK